MLANLHLLVSYSFAHAKQHLSKGIIRRSIGRAAIPRGAVIEQVPNEDNSLGTSTGGEQAQQPDEELMPFTTADFDTVFNMDDFFVEFDDIDPVSPVEIETESALPQQPAVQLQLAENDRDAPHVTGGSPATSNGGVGRGTGGTSLDQVQSGYSGLPVLTAPSTRASNPHTGLFYCPHTNCSRSTGGRGFKRSDNLLVHRRNVHKENIERQPSGRAARRGR
ncbi:hypothetical protein BJ508DRAFT_119233 [Ascobolus immersus RN42]|uniref:C2H2-type domain-containing protein n=1 Tax=Ascobolus immersus RN42 TaxID=1160509 RepID=A0A3N4IKM8_ASCIM|nr:hypothetical protein BJ508DRAFT_119233 [Ascobolus immersus RN42]